MDSISIGTTILLFALWAALLILRSRLRRRLQRLAQPTGGTPFPSFTATAEALALTVAVASAGPLLCWFIGWRLTQSESTSLTGLLGPALMTTAIILGPAELVRQLFRSGGVMQSHLGGDAAACRGVRVNIRWLMVSGTPLLLLVSGCSTFRDGHWRESLGRWAFMAAMVLFAVILSRLFHHRGHLLPMLLGGNEPRWLYRLRFLVPLAAMAFPLGLALAAVMGYADPAQPLAERFIVTVWCVVGVLIARRLLARGSVIRQWRRALRGAEQRARAEAETAAWAAAASATQRAMAASQGAQHNRDVRRPEAVPPRGPIGRQPAPTVLAQRRHVRQERRDAAHPAGHRHTGEAASVSVVIPTWNRADTLGRAIVSAASQQPLEVVVIDDASTDDTIGIVEQLRGVYPCVRLVQNPEKAADWQAAAAAVYPTLAGTHVLGMGADDTLATGVVNSVTRYPDAAVVFHDYWVADPAGNVTGAVFNGYEHVTTLRPEQMCDRLRTFPYASETGIGSAIRKDCLLWLAGLEYWHMGPWSDAIGYAAAAARWGCVFVPGPGAMFTVDPGGYGAQGREGAQAATYHAAVRAFLRRVGMREDTARALCVKRGVVHA